MSATAIRESNATIAVGSGASFTLNGDDDTVLASGSGLAIQVFGAGNFVSIGGNGTWARDGADDVITFATAGTLRERRFARVDANASHSFVRMIGDDTLGLYGSGDWIIANGTGDGIWIGRNGRDATGADIDAVRGLTHGTLFELQDSHVRVV